MAQWYLLLSTSLLLTAAVCPWDGSSCPRHLTPQPCGAELWHDAMERTVNSLAESANAAQQQQAELVQDLAAANVEMNGLLTHIMEM